MELWIGFICQLYSVNGRFHALCHKNSIGISNKNGVGERQIDRLTGYNAKSNKHEVKSN